MYTSTHDNVHRYTHFYFVFDRTLKRKQHLYKPKSRTQTYTPKYDIIFFDENKVRESAIIFYDRTK